MKRGFVATILSIIAAISLTAYASGVTQALATINVAALINTAQLNGLQPKALKAALNAYAWAYQRNQLGSNKNTLTVVDFTLPSYKKRLWVIDLKNNKVLLNTYTAQGKNSGLVYATHFSNDYSTDESSLGLYTTAGVYYGEHAQSVRLRGLEPGVNSHAYARAIEIHAAWYVTPEFIKAHHRAGRSWGCFAVNPAIKNRLINYIKGGSALFAYAGPENKDPIVKNGPFA